MRIRLSILVIAAMGLSQCSSRDSDRSAAPPNGADSSWLAVQAKVAQVEANLASFERVDHGIQQPKLRIDWEIYLSDDRVVCIIEKADMGAEGSGEITNIYEREQLISRAGWERMKLAEKPGAGLHDIQSKLLFDGGWPVFRERTIDDEVVPIENWQVEAFQRQSEDLLERLKREVRNKR